MTSFSTKIDPGKSKLVFRPAKNPHWGFHDPQSELSKVVIDLRPKLRVYPNQPSGPPHVLSDNSLKFLPKHPIKQETGKESSRTLYIPEAFRKENQKPLPAGKINYQFGGESIPMNKYYGGPILDNKALRWRPVFLTRASGEVVGAAQSQIPLPPSMSQVVKGNGVMSSSQKIQSGLWVGPRLLISTLHLYHWQSGQASDAELDIVVQEGRLFDVEQEISSEFLCEHSAKVQLIRYSREHDLGIFRLRDQDSSRTDWLDVDYLMERDEIEKLLLPHRLVGCLGYSDKIEPADFIHIQEQARFQLHRILGPQAFQAEPLDLNLVVRAGMRSFSPGTLDHASGISEHFILGVSCPLWKGSSGGPCVLLDGYEAGAVIGLVQGHDQLSEPYNLVNGFPNGLRQLLKTLM